LKASQRRAELEIGEVVAEWEERVYQVTQERDTLKAMVIEQQKDLEAAKAQISDLEEKVHDHAARLEVQSKEKRKTVAVHQRTMMRGAISKVQERKTQNALEEQMQEIDRLKASMEELKLSYARAQEESSELRRELVASRAHGKELEEMSKELTLTLESKMDAEASLRDRVDGLQQSLETQRLQNSVESMTDSVSPSSAAKGCGVNRMSLCAELAGMSGFDPSGSARLGPIRESESDDESEDGDVPSRVEEFEMLQREHERLESTIVEHLRASEEQQQLRLACLESECTRWTGYVESASEQEQVVTEMVREERRRRFELKSECERLLAQHAEYADEHAASSESLAAATAEAEEWQQMCLARLETECARWADHAENALEGAWTATQTVGEEQRQMFRLRSECESLEAECVTYATALAASSESMVAAAEAVREGQLQRARLESECKRLECECEEWAVNVDNAVEAEWAAAESAEEDRQQAEDLRQSSAEFLEAAKRAQRKCSELQSLLSNAGQAESESLASEELVVEELQQELETHARETGRLQCLESKGDQAKGALALWMREENGSLRSECEDVSKANHTLESNCQWLRAEGERNVESNCRRLEEDYAQVCRRLWDEGERKAEEQSHACAIFWEECKREAEEQSRVCLLLREEGERDRCTAEEHGYQNQELRRKCADLQEAASVGSRSNLSWLVDEELRCSYLERECEDLQRQVGGLAETESAVRRSVRDRVECRRRLEHECERFREEVEDVEYAVVENEAYAREQAQHAWHLAHECEQIREAEVECVRGVVVESHKYAEDQAHLAQLLSLEFEQLRKDRVQGRRHSQHERKGLKGLQEEVSRVEGVAAESDTLEVAIAKEQALHTQLLLRKCEQLSQQAHQAEAEGALMQQGSQKSRCLEGECGRLREELELAKELLRLEHSSLRECEMLAEGEERRSVELEQRWQCVGRECEQLQWRATSAMEAEGMLCWSAQDSLRRVGDLECIRERLLEGASTSWKLEQDEFSQVQRLRQECEQLRDRAAADATEELLRCGELQRRCERMQQQLAHALEAQCEAKRIAREEILETECKANQLLRDGVDRNEQLFLNTVELREEATSALAARDSILETECKAHQLLWDGVCSNEQLQLDCEELRVQATSALAAESDNRVLLIQEESRWNDLEGHCEGLRAQVACALEAQCEAQRVAKEGIVEAECNSHRLLRECLLKNEQLWFDCDELREKAAAAIAAELKAQSGKARLQSQLESVEAHATHNAEDLAEVECIEGLRRRQLQHECDRLQDQLDQMTDSELVVHRSSEFWRCGHEELTHECAFLRERAESAAGAEVQARESLEELREELLRRTVQDGSGAGGGVSVQPHVLSCCSDDREACTGKGDVLGSPNLLPPGPKRLKEQNVGVAEAVQEAGAELRLWQRCSSPSGPAPAGPGDASSEDVQKHLLLTPCLWVTPTPAEQQVHVGVGGAPCSGGGAGAGGEATWRGGGALEQRTAEVDMLKLECRDLREEVMDIAEAEVVAYRSAEIGWQENVQFQLKCNQLRAQASGSAASEHEASAIATPNEGEYRHRPLHPSGWLFASPSRRRCTRDVDFSGHRDATSPSGSQPSPQRDEEERNHLELLLEQCARAREAERQFHRSAEVAIELRHVVKEMANCTVGLG